MEEISIDKLQFILIQLGKNPAIISKSTLNIFLELIDKKILDISIKSSGHNITKETLEGFFVTSMTLVMIRHATMCFLLEMEKGRYTDRDISLRQEFDKLKSPYADDWRGLSRIPSK